MNLLQSMAHLSLDAIFALDKKKGATPETVARSVLAQVQPSGWLIDFPNGRVFVDSETLMLINKANGYTVTPVYAGEQL